MGDSGRRPGRICLLVAGMHRSGTSLLTDCLARRGASLPAQLIPPDRHNPRGYFEPIGLNRMFTRILAAAGSSWDDWHPLPCDWQSIPDVAAELARLECELHEAYGESQLFLLKDPRVCRVLGVLASEIRKIQMDVRVVIPVRNPLEVARSLQARDSFSLRKGGLLWLRHVLDAERSSRGLRRAVVSYDDLMADWRGVAARIEAELHLPLPQSDGTTDGPVAAGFRHHHVLDQHDFRLLGAAHWVGECHHALLRLVDDAEDPAALSVLDRLGAEFDGYCGAFGRTQPQRMRSFNPAPTPEDRNGQSVDLPEAIEADRRIADLEEQVTRRDRLLEENATRAREEAAAYQHRLKNQALLLERALLEARVLKHTAAEMRNGIEQAERPWLERLGQRALRFIGLGPRSTRAQRRQQEKWARDAALIRASGLFDPDWYCARYPDAVATGLEPLEHFVRIGDREGRSPGPLFDSRWYREHYPDITKGAEPTLLHFLRHGLSEGRHSLPADSPSRFDGADDPIPLQRTGHSLYDEEGNPDYAAHYLATLRSADSRQGPAEYEELTARFVDSDKSAVKAIAFYLPQFHPIAENDRAWGKGFTEWTNVSKAVPEFLGHYQPHLPGELGFYDLRVPGIMARQIELAKQHGLHGFCFHHYWFGGKRVLEKPVQAFLSDGTLDIPFCLCWANENWSRRWDGGEQDIIIAQSHSPEDDIAFIDHLLPVFRDDRYIRVDGKPMLLVYQPAVLPDARATTERWREHCRHHGIGELFLVYAQTFRYMPPPADIGFDAAVQFPPHGTNLPDISTSLRLLNPRYRGVVYDCRSMAKQAVEAASPDYPLFPGLFPSWDNSPRRPGRGTLFAHADPALYRTWLDGCFRRAQRDLPPGQRFVFINAWNEWGEGAHLEPDRRYGYAWLNATASVVAEHSIHHVAQSRLTGSR